MIVNLKRQVQFLKEQLVLKDNYFREEVVFLCNKLDIALSNQVNNSHTHIVSQYSSNIECKEDDKNQSDFHQQDQMETVIYATPDTCDQMETVIYKTLDICDQIWLLKCCKNQNFHYIFYIYVI